jgi:hypothetical protein
MRKGVLWGYHWDDYREIFDLSEASLTSRFLEYGSGVSAVNQELHQQGAWMVSCDPMFTLDCARFASQAAFIFEEAVASLRASKNEGDVSDARLDAFIASRRQGMAHFFSDYEQGKREGRYLAVTEDTLPFLDHTFDTALSTHYLFVDAEDHEVDMHLQTIRELARVAKEVRIFPLMDRHGHASSLLGPVLLGLQQEEYGVEVREVMPHRGTKGHAMLRVWAQQCWVKTEEAIKK